MNHRRSADLHAKGLNQWPKSQSLSRAYSRSTNAPYFFVSPSAPIGSGPGWLRVTAMQSMMLSETLVENAVAHAPPSTVVTVSISANAAISVADRGPGIPAEQRKHIFERFWRESGKGSPGAGLALAIVTEIMKTQHGGISVDDNRGRGIVFTLRFGQLMGW